MPSVSPALVVCQQAGGCPAATHFYRNPQSGFSLLAKGAFHARGSLTLQSKVTRTPKVSKEKATLLSAEFLGSESKFAEPVARPLGAVQSTAAKLASDPNNSTCGARSSRGRARTRCAQTIARPDPLSAVLLGAYRRGWERNRERMRGATTRKARRRQSTGRPCLHAAASTRGQMKSPSLAQRGEGGLGVGVGSWTCCPEQTTAQRDASNSINFYLESPAPPHQ